MTKEVLVSISGLQFAVNSDEVIEVITGGQYFSRGGKQYVLYDEMMEEYEGISKNTIKFTDGIVDITKKGLTNVHMIFEEKKKNMTNYATPYGNILIGIDAKSIKMTEEEERIEVSVDYALEVNYEHLANCKIRMDIRSRGGEGFSLQ